ncbi:HET-domain-containing protein, partial [Ophiobolus disseminans]
MRLLHVDTRQLEEFFGDAIPPYAILSHTWGPDEVVFRDFENEEYRNKHSYAKIDGCCREAKKSALSYVWVDTCCIDKSSSAELSEAINSMFQWYRVASVCYAYLEDVPPGEDPYQFGTAFRKSRWHTRGWTLQELLAPKRVIFFNSAWTEIFNHNAGQELIRAEATSMNRGQDPYMSHYRMAERKLRTALLSGITTIAVQVLREEIPLESVSAACKFSWAAARKTTRIEDSAYCLLGLMGVNMPLLYGEGEKAFVRLQEAVLGSSDDISVLAWGYDLSWKVTVDAIRGSILASSPSEF